jgi:hypothetical protein
MTPTPTPSPATLILQPGPAQWWEIVAGLSPVAVLLAAIVAAIIGLLTLKQRSQADERSEWWVRAQWALDASLSDNPKRAEVGLNVMSVLAESRLARREEIEILSAAWEEPLESAEQSLGASREVDSGVERGDNRDTNDERDR